MKILLTGSTGFIGKNLLKSLILNGYSVKEVLRKNHLKKDSCGIENNAVFKSDVFIYNGDINRLMAFFLNEKFDAVVHLASFYIKNHNETDIDNLVSSNILFPTKLLECASKSGCRFFLNTGTFWQHYRNAKYDPVNLYAATKQAFEDIAKYYESLWDIKFVTLKLNDTYGPGDTREKIFNLWKKISESGEEIKMSAGEQEIDTVYIDDVINAYIKIVELAALDCKNLKSQYAVAAEKRYTLKELAEIFERVSGKKLKIKWGALNYGPKAVFKPWQRYNPVPGWTPRVCIENGIRMILKDN